MQLNNLINIIKRFIVDKYNRLKDCIKNMGSKKPKINNQTTNQDIHIVKVKVKKIGNKNLKINEN